MYLRLARGGTYYRVCKPDWHDGLDTSYAKEHGGRWNPPGAFGALYLSATLAVAAANAREQHAGRAVKLFDLKPDRRPRLLTVRLERRRFVDVVTPEGVHALGIPAEYPWGVDHDSTRPIGAQMYGNREPGIACRSNAECRPTSWLGEELALFDHAGQPEPVGNLKPFSAWYPDPIPG